MAQVFDLRSSRVSPFFSGNQAQSSFSRAFIRERPAFPRFAHFRDTTCVDGVLPSLTKSYAAKTTPRQHEGFLHSTRSARLGMKLVLLTSILLCLSCLSIAQAQSLSPATAMIEASRLAQEGKHEEAIQAYDSVLKLGFGPSVPEARYRKGICLQALRKHRDAVAHAGRNCSNQASPIPSKKTPCSRRPGHTLLTLMSPIPA